jgi:hypothetical protein
MLLLFGQIHSMIVPRLYVIELMIVLFSLQSFLSMLCAMQFGIFLFFAGWVVIMSLFVLFFLPETKGVPLEDMPAVFR